LVGRDGILRAGWQPALCGHLQTSSLRFLGSLQVLTLLVFPPRLGASAVKNSFLFAPRYVNPQKALERRMLH
jgi:hypothetical protein